MRAITAWMIGLLAMLAPLRATAAWTQPKGEALIITSISDYLADARFDAAGRRAAAGEYRKQELSVYGVYGFTESLSLGAQPTFIRLYASPAIGEGRQTTNALSHVELFARQRLLAGGGWVFSAQALIKLPGEKAVEREPLIESSNRAAEGRLLFGRSGRVFEREYFSALEAAFRARGDGEADQARADATFGIRPWPGWQLIVQSFNIVSTNRGGDLEPGNFDLYKAQASVLRDLPRGFALQLGGFSEYAGRNIGAGDALFVALWSRF